MINLYFRHKKRKIEKMIIKMFHMVCVNIMHKSIYVGFKLGQNLMGGVSKQKYMQCEGMLPSNFNKDKGDKLTTLFMHNNFVF